VTDLEALTALNLDYVNSVQRSDTERFDQILSDDFLNTNPDGSLVDRKGFLAQIAPKAKISNLICHDVDVRLMGDFAIIHACTSYTRETSHSPLAEASGGSPYSGHESPRV
jgi:ketosteroid isomerase-like protein